MRDRVGPLARRAVNRLRAWRLERDTWVVLQSEADHRKASWGWHLLPLLP